MKFIIYISPVGAMVARRPPKAKAAGSIPVLGALILFFQIRFWSVT